MVMGLGGAGGLGAFVGGQHAGQHVAALGDTGPEILPLILGAAGAKQFMVHKMPSPFANSLPGLRSH